VFLLNKDFNVPIVGSQSQTGLLRVVCLLYPSSSILHSIMKSKGSKNRKAKTDTRSSIYKSKLRQTKLPFAKVSWSGPANDLPQPSVASVDEQKPDAEEDSDDDIISPSSRRNSTKVRITSDLGIPPTQLRK